MVCCIRVRQHYLGTHKIKVFTNNVCLKYFDTQPKVSTKQLRWHMVGANSILKLHFAYLKQYKLKFNDSFQHLQYMVSIVQNMLGRFFYKKISLQILFILLKF